MIMSKIKKRKKYLIFGFPGTGKTYFVNNVLPVDPRYKHIKIADLDAGEFIWAKDSNGNKIYDKEKTNWLKEYKTAIKDKIKEGYRVIFVSTHFEVIDYLKDIDELEKIIVIPSINLKQYYLDLYTLRKSSIQLKDKINKNFETMLFTIKEIYKKYNDQYSIKLVQFTKREDNIEELMDELFFSSK